MLKLQKILVTTVFWALAQISMAEGVSFDSASKTNSLGQQEFLPVEEAFKPNIFSDQQGLHVDFLVTDEYYLYKKRFKTKADGTKLSAPTFSGEASPYQDMAFGEVDVFFNQVAVTIPTNQIPENAKSIEVGYQGCATGGLCYPPQKIKIDLTEHFGNFDGELAAAIETSTNSGGGSDSQVMDSELASLTLFSAILFAMIGGMILNLMPCVFPVLSLKAMHLTQFSDDIVKAKMLSWVYTAGVVLSFLLVAGVLLLLRSFGEWVGWGFQLQSPYFVAGLIFLFFVMALSMAGLIEFGQSFMGLGQNLTEKEGPAGSFFTGVLATLVATPCTAPFMGSAIGFALVQPAYVSLLIFGAMGFGLALPILLVTYIPVLAKKLPKPGPWMEGFRQLMSFPLFATVIWLLWVLAEIQGPDAMFDAGIGLVLVALAAWKMLDRTGKESAGKKVSKIVTRYGSLVLALMLVLDQSEEVDPWQSYEANILEQAQSAPYPTFINVTAAWCITCKANERVALSGDDFFQMANERDVDLVKADWTNPSPEVDALLNRFNRVGVPLYVYFPGDNRAPIVLPQVLTPSKVDDTFGS